MSSAVPNMSDAELEDEVIRSQTEIDRLLVQQARLLGEWDARKVWAGNGSRSAASRLATVTGLSGEDAHKLIVRAKRLANMPLCRDAFASPGR